tara:strand:+ start:166 stop:423 length:258 start_codon:yes stop_codon:yes gene_type:complete
MNNRILELDKQAANYALSVCDANGCYQGKEYLTVVKEKFAELIVKECIDVLHRTSKEAEMKNTYMGEDVPTIAHMLAIEKHFGVK